MARAHGPGLRGEPEVRVCIINEGERDKPRPAILHIQGDGFIVGEGYLAINSLQHLAGEIDCVFVTVDFRLAPQTCFPGALNDNYAHFFVGEDIEFPHRLIDAGVACELIVVPGAFYGFDFASETILFRKFKAALFGAIRAGLAIST